MDTSHFEKSDAPDIYSDSVRVASTPYSFIFQFGLVTESPGEQKSVVTVRMSPQHAWVFSHILGKHLNEYQNNIAPIIPRTTPRNGRGDSPGSRRASSMRMTHIRMSRKTRMLESNSHVVFTVSIGRVSS